MADGWIHQHTWDTEELLGSESFVEAHSGFLLFLEISLPNSFFFLFQSTSSRTNWRRERERRNESGKRKRKKKGIKTRNRRRRRRRKNTNWWMKSNGRTGKWSCHRKVSYWPAIGHTVEAKSLHTPGLEIFNLTHTSQLRCLQDYRNWFINF